MCLKVFFIVLKTFISIFTLFFFLIMVRKYKKVFEKDTIKCCKIIMLIHFVS